MTKVTGEKENPYLAGRQEYADRYYDLTKLAHNWCMAALVAGVMAIVATGGLIAVALQHKVVPYAVEFNEHDEVARVVRADEAAAPSTNQIRASLRQLVIGARTVFGDRRAQKVMIDQTYAMILPDSPAFKSLTAFHSENNPYVRSQKEAVEISVNSVMPVSDETWRVEWTETVKQANGQVISTSIWQGSFTVVIVPPNDDKQILINPLGVYVKQFSWAPRQI